MPLGKRDPTRFYFAADLLRVAHVCLPLLINDQHFPRSLHSRVLPRVCIVDLFDEAVLNYIFFEAPNKSFAASW